MRPYTLPTECYQLMVLEAGIEPARLLEREILSLLCLPISPLEQISNYFFKERVNCLTYTYIIQSFSVCVNRLLKYFVAYPQGLEP